MAFGMLGDGDAAPAPVDMIVGPGNAFVAEAKRQLFGRVGIDLLAGPSEVAVIADETADPELVAADLLAQAEHGPTSPAVLITTSEDLGRSVIAEVERQLDELDRLDWAGAPGGETPRAAWRDHGVVMVARDREHAAALADEVATEHLEVHTAEDAWYLERLRNYGSLFLGSRATVAFSDKAIGTNHTLPTGRAARYTGGLSVAKFLKTLTYQRIDSDAGRPGRRPPRGRDLTQRPDARPRGDGHQAPRALGLAGPGECAPCGGGPHGLHNATLSCRALT